MRLIDVQENKNNIVKKHNELIKAKGALNQTSQKMLAMLISMIREDDTDFHKYALKLEDYKKEIGSKHKGKEDYVKQALELMRNPFCIYENGKRKYFNWCTMVEPDEIEGYIIFQIHSELKPYLLNFKKEIGNFTEYNLINILNLRGKYSPRLYEFFISKWRQYKYYNRTSKSYSFEISLDWLKEFLGLKDKKYKYNDIKRQIIDKAKEDFEKYTDIKFEYIEKKKIRKKVISIEVTIEENNKGSNDYLKDRHTYINWIRKNFIPDPSNNKFPKILEIGTLRIAIDIYGKLYISTDGEPKYLDNKEADLLWTLLYKLEKKEITQEELIESFFTEHQDHIQQEQNNSYDNIDFTQFYGRSIAINDQLFHNIILVNQLDQDILEVVFLDNSRIKIKKDLFFSSLVSG